MKSIAFRLAADSIVISALACGGGDRGNTFTEPPPPPSTPKLTTLGVILPVATLLAGQTMTATATGVDQYGAPIATGTVAWSTASTTVATVNGNGLVSAVAPGQTQVIATAGGKTAQAALTVGQTPVATVSVAPLTQTIAVGATLQLTPTTRDANNNVLTGRVITWGTSNQTKATVDANGLVTGVAAGTANITATSEGKSGAAQITVNVPAPPCNSGIALQLAVGGIHALTQAEKNFLCLGGGAATSRDALISFHSTNVAASRIPLQVTGANTAAIQSGAPVLIQPRPTDLVGPSIMPRK